MNKKNDRHCFAQWRSGDTKGVNMLLNEFKDNPIQIIKVGKKEFLLMDREFSGLELLARTMGLIDPEKIARNIVFLRYVADKFGMDEELFEEFTEHKLYLKKEIL